METLARNHFGLVMAMVALLALGCSGSDDKSEDVANSVDTNQGDVAADFVCLPDCAGKTCGDNGCGGVCGKCFTPEGGQDDSLCTDVGTCCVPACAGKNCGDNSCGGLCGECNEGVECLNGQCADTCIPDCAGKDCGDDGCAGICGNCLDKSGAINNDLCVEGACCIPNCQFKNCGADGCGGSCGSCDDGLTCENGTCADVCVPDCDGKECGYDGCTGSCGNCSGGTCARTISALPATRIVTARTVAVMAAGDCVAPAMPGPSARRESASAFPNVPMLSVATIPVAVAAAYATTVIPVPEMPAKTGPAYTPSCPSTN